MPKRYIKDWSYGMDVLSSPRNLPPNSEEDTLGGSPYTVNMSITKTGSLVTSTGYEVVSSIASTGGIVGLLDYDKDTSNRYLIIAHDDDYYSITGSSLTWDNTNLGDFGTAATYMGGVVFNGEGVVATGTITISSYGDLVSGSNQDIIKVKDVIFVAQTGASSVGDEVFQAATNNNSTANDLCEQINGHADLKKDVIATVSGAVVTVTSRKLGEEGNGYELVYTNNTGTVGLTISGANLTGGSTGRMAILGAGEATDNNRPQDADITNAMGNVANSSVNGSYIFATFLGRLFFAKDKTVYYTECYDQDKIEGATGFNDIVTAMVVEGQRMIVFTRSYHQGVYFDYDDDNNISMPLREPYERQYGSIGHKTVHTKDASAAYYAKQGFYALGQEQGYDEQGIPRPISLSERIDPSLKYVNFDSVDKGTSIYDSIHKESLWALPYGSASYNNLVFVYNWIHKAWTLRNGIYPTDFAYFRESGEHIDSIYFGDHFNSRLLKFNNEYSYDNDGYVRKWKSKIFTMEADLLMKKWNYITIVGSMYESTEFTVRLTIDDHYEEFTIDSDSLEKTETGYIGDNWIGDEWVGGGEAPESNFYRFKNKIRFPMNLRMGFEMQMEIYNSGAQQPFKLDGIEIDFDYLPEKRLPAKYNNNNLLP